MATGNYWKKSSFSSGKGEECVEVSGPWGAQSADRLTRVTVRDSKNRGDLELPFTPDEWRRFLSTLK